MSKVSIDNAQHYRWGKGCDGWHLLRDPDLSVIQEKVPPGAGETRHRHALARQFFFVLAGVAELEVDGERVTLGPGEGRHVPAGRPHKLENPGPDPVTFLVISSPASHGDRIEDDRPS